MNNCLDRGLLDKSVVNCFELFILYIFHFVNQSFICQLTLLAVEISSNVCEVHCVGVYHLVKFNCVCDPLHHIPKILVCSFADKFYKKL